MFRNSVFSLCALLTLSAPVLGGDQIYRWVDESGVVHFGDAPPSGDAADVRALELEIAPAAEGAAEQYSINSQLERLYRTRPVPPQKPAKPPPPVEVPYPPPPSIIYQPLYAPYYGHPSKHRPGHLPARPGWHPHPPHHPVPTPRAPKAPSGRLWLPR
jgi:hypothetical protein